MSHSVKTRLLIVACTCYALVSVCLLTLFSTSIPIFEFQFTEESQYVNVDSYFVKTNDVKPVKREPKRHFEVLPEYLDRYTRQILSVKDPSFASMCTMVMLTYDREDLLFSLLNHYCKVKSLHKILVIWNNVNKSIPNNIIEIRDTCTTDLLFIQERENKLTNRFKPRREIETECELIIS